MYLRQSTSQVFRIGPFLDSTDGVTPETGLTIANTDVDISKDGAAFAAKNSGGLTADGSNGWYSGTFDTTDTGTVGEFYAEVTVSGALPVWVRYWVIEESIYDAIYASSATGLLPANITQISGDSTAADNLELDYDGTGFAKANSTIGTCTANTDMVGTDGALLAASINLTGGAIDNVTLVATTTTNTDMRGTDSAATATDLATAQLDLDIITGSDGTTLATLQPNNDFGAISKNAAFPNFVFPMVLTSDHVTAATGLTVTGERSIDAGAFASVAGTIAEISDGFYQFDALAADTNGDVITWKFSSATADDTSVPFKTT